MPARPRPSVGSFADFRIELFFKSADELRTQASFLHSRGVRRLNITNKKKGDALAQWVRATLEAAPGSHVCPHWSIKQHHARGAQGTHEALAADLREFASLAAEHASARAQGACDVLLINGSGPKKAYNTVTALQRLAQDRRADSAGAACMQGCRLHVAFNPYFPAAEHRETERSRFREKVATGVVAGVWLQMGSDLALLRSGLAFLKQALAESKTPDARIYGSVFVPSKQLLAQMRFRPWNGVFLRDEYLASVDAAESLTAQLLGEYHAAGVVPLVESRVATDAQLQSAMQLLSAACGVPAENLLGGDTQRGAPAKRRAS